jgi:sodium-coupled neutral amino acid transporter 2
MILAADFFSGSKGIPQGLCKNAEGCQWVVDLFSSRVRSVFILTACLLFPLSCLRQLNALRFTSLLSVVGMFYLLWLLMYEYASATPEDLADVTVRWTTPEIGIFRAAPIVNVAFIAHYNVPRFYEELHERTIGKFSLAVCISLAMCTCVYLLIGVFGYLRYGEETKSDVLNNLPDDSTIAIVGRLALAGVVLFTYPLAFNSHRASAVALLQVYSPNFSAAKPLHFYGLTVVLVSLTFLLGSTIKDIGIVLDYKGAILGGCIAFAFPGWMFLAGVYPRSVYWCCVKPRSPQGSGGLEQDLLEDGESAHGDVQDDVQASFSKRWKSVAIFFFYYAFVMGVTGVASTTAKLVNGD